MAHGFRIPPFPTRIRPEVMAYLALVWRTFGYSIAATRSAMLALASLAVFFTFLLGWEINRARAPAANCRVVPAVRPAVLHAGDDGAAGYAGHVVHRPRAGFILARIATPPRPSPAPRWCWRKKPASFCP